MTRSSPKDGAPEHPWGVSPRGVSEEQGLPPVAADQPCCPEALMRDMPRRPSCKGLHLLVFGTRRSSDNGDRCLLDVGEYLLLGLLGLMPSILPDMTGH